MSKTFDSTAEVPDLEGKVIVVIGDKVKLKDSFCSLN
jgi:hypothetical protein